MRPDNEISIDKTLTQDIGPKLFDNFSDLIKLVENIKTSKIKTPFRISVLR